MRILTHRVFDKTLKRLPIKLKEKVHEQVEIFLENAFDQRLNNHTLNGKYLGYRSIDITGDWRIIFEEVDSETVKFVNIGTHSQLYG